MAYKLSTNAMSEEDKLFVTNALTLTDDECLNVADGNAYIPYAFARRTFRLDAPVVDDAMNRAPVFRGELRSEQIAVADACRRELDATGTMLLAACPGFGKTVTALKLACDLRLPTCVVVNKIVLVDQWIRAAETFTSEKMQYVTSRTDRLDPTAFFYVVNAINVRKKSEEFWSPVKFLIVDELHQIVTKVLTRSLLKFVPTRVLGLSATPYRFDEYDKAIGWFFGKNVVGKNLSVKHRVYYVETNFRPEIKFTATGLDWNAVLTSQSENEARNNLIVDIVSDKPDRTWMILVKRVVHAEILQQKFTAKGISCATLIKNQASFDRTCKILIGTTSKIGVGFDHVAIDALCVAADVKNYFVQFLGRCMRRPDANPVVVDLVDDFGPLRKHFEERKKEYEARGGFVTKYSS